jgi:hypothetical protein
MLYSQGFYNSNSKSRESDFLGQHCSQKCAQRYKYIIHRSILSLSAAEHNKLTKLQIIFVDYKQQFLPNSTVT